MSTGADLWKQPQNHTAFEQAALSHWLEEHVGEAGYWIK